MQVSYLWDIEQTFEQVSRETRTPVRLPERKSGWFASAAPANQPTTKSQSFGFRLLTLAFWLRVGGNLPPLGGRISRRPIAPDLSAPRLYTVFSIQFFYGGPRISYPSLSIPIIPRIIGYVKDFLKFFWLFFPFGGKVATLTNFYSLSYIAARHTYFFTRSSEIPWYFIL